MPRNVLEIAELCLRMRWESRDYISVDALEGKRV
jgi:hypothetical protein